MAHNVPGVLRGGGALLRTAQCFFTAMGFVACAAAHASVALVGDRTSLLGTQTTIDWPAPGGGEEFADATTSVLNGPLTVTGAGRFAIVLGSTYNADFLASDSLLVMLDLATGDYTAGVFDIAIGAPVSGFGTQVSSNLFGPSSVVASVFNSANALLGSFTIAVANNGNADGSATFVGFNSTATDISRVTLSGLGSGAAINAVTLATAQTVVVNPVPSPATLPLLGLALAAGVFTFPRKRLVARTRRGAPGL